MSIRSSCLVSAVRLYFAFRRLGYVCEFVYTNYHFKVYIWTVRCVYTLSFESDFKASFWTAFWYLLPVHRGHLTIRVEELVR